VQLIFEDVILSNHPTHHSDLAAFIEPWVLLKHELKLNGANHDEHPADIIYEERRQEHCEGVHLQTTLPGTDSTVAMLLQTPASLEVLISLHDTCREVLYETSRRLESEHVTLTLVKQLLKFYSPLDDPCQMLKELFDSATPRRYSNQPMDITSTQQLPRAFLRCLQPVETGSDGNCFYRAVSHAIFGTEKLYELVRVRILLDVLENDGLYIHFITRADPEDNYDDLVRSLGTLGAYAGDAVIYAASRVLRRPIHVYTDFPNAPLDDYEFLRYMKAPRNNRHRRTLFDDNDAFNPPINMHYRCSSNGGPKDHFVALLQKKGATTLFPCNSDEYVKLRRFGF